MSLQPTTLALATNVDEVSDSERRPLLPIVRAHAQAASDTVELKTVVISLSFTAARQSAMSRLPVRRIYPQAITGIMRSCS